MSDPELIQKYKLLQLKASHNGFEVQMKRNQISLRVENPDFAEDEKVSVATIAEALSYLQGWSDSRQFSKDIWK